jgi:hypothetical protein
MTSGASGEAMLAMFAPPSDKNNAPPRQRAASQPRGWPIVAKILNFDAPPISKSHGEDQKEMWKEKKGGKVKK